VKGASGPPPTLSLVRRFLPLSLTDVVMTLGDPLQTMALSHLSNTREVLAAVGMVKSVAVVLESPIIMILHASTTFSRSAASMRALARFTLLFGGLLVGIFLILAWRPVSDWLFVRVFSADPSVAALGRVAFILMIPWPGVIAWRRFHQGFLIGRGKSRLVGWASVGRLLWVLVALATGVILQVNGAFLAGVTLIGAVVVEALAVTVLAWRTRAVVPRAAKVEDAGAELPTSVAGVTRFYVPLASTMLVVWGGRAVLTSLVARAADGLLALAVWPAAWGLVLSIANATRMVQQVVISSAGEARKKELVQFVLLVGTSCSALLFLLGFARAGGALLGAFLGKHDELVLAAAPVVRIAAIFPLLLAVQNALQGLLIRAGRNWRINSATLAGVATTLGVALALVRAGRPGAFSAAWAMVAGASIEILLLGHGVARPPSPAQVGEGHSAR
jgi:progressive ankylosis protein